MVFLKREMGPESSRRRLVPVFAAWISRRDRLPSSIPPHRSHRSHPRHVQYPRTALTPILSSLLSSLQCVCDRICHHLRSSVIIHTPFAAPLAHTKSIYTSRPATRSPSK